MALVSLTSPSHRSLSRSLPPSLISFLPPLFPIFLNARSLDPIFLNARSLDSGKRAPGTFVTRLARFSPSQPSSHVGLRTDLGLFTSIFPPVLPIVRRGIHLPGGHADHRPQSGVTQIGGGIPARVRLGKLDIGTGEPTGGRQEGGRDGGREGT